LASLAAATVIAVFGGGIWVALQQAAPLAQATLPQGTPLIPPQGIALIPPPAAKPPLRQAALPIIPAAIISPAAPAHLLLRVAGSNVAGQSIAPELARAFLVQMGDSGIRIEPGQDANETLVTGLNHGRREAIAIDTTTTAEGFNLLREGQTDLAMAARQISPAETESLHALGDMNTPAAEHVIAVNGLVLVTNASNPLRMLTTDQVQGLLSGTYSDWNSIGGPPGLVSVYVANRHSEAGEAASRMVLRGGTWAPNTKDMKDDEQIARAVSQDKNAIGVLSLPSLLLHRHFAADLRMLAIADTGSPPLVPTNRPAMATLDYPYAFRLYLYVSPMAASPVAKRFIDFVDSSDGEAVADTQGLVSQSMSPSELILPESATDTFRQFVAGTQLLAVHFRFLTNSSSLDVAGQRDLDRVTKYLVANKYGGDNLVVAGFTDNRGSPEANLTLSQKRAEAMAALLTQRGLKPNKVAGFGAELPLTNNSTEEGRERNRRAEIYLLP